MMQIWKFPLRDENEQTLQMPENAKVLCVQLQNGGLCLWAEVEENERLTSRTFETFGTGYQIPDGPRAYIGTVQIGRVVLHIYENHNERI